MSKGKKFIRKEDTFATFLKQFKQSCELAAEIKALTQNFDALFTFNKAFPNILNKAQIIKNAINEDGGVELAQLEDPSTFQTSIFVNAENCPKNYVETKDGCFHNCLGLALQKEKGELKERSLLFDGKGEPLIFSYYEKQRTEVCDFYNTRSLFFFNLPLIIWGITKTPSSSKARLTLEEIVRKNPVSTIANIYKYVSKHGKEMVSLSTKLASLDKLFAKFIALENTSQVFTKIVATEENKKNFSGINNHFIVNSGETAIPYLITEEAGLPAIKLDVSSESITDYHYQRNGVSFPALLLFKEKEIIPYFFKEPAFERLLVDKKDKNFISKNNLNLVKIETKAEERVKKKEKELRQQENIRREDAFEKMYNYYDSFGAYPSYGNYSDISSLPSTAKNWEEFRKNELENLTENFQEVLTTAEQHIGKIFAKNPIVGQEKIIEKLSTTLTICKTKGDEVACLLANIYKNEILLSSL